MADAFVAAFGASGKAVASYDNAVADGDTITITGFKAVQPKRTDRDITVATIVITGAAERQPGGFTAASMTFSDGSASTARMAPPNGRRRWSPMRSCRRPTKSAR